MESVQFQVYMFTVTLYGGILIGILFDIYKSIKKLSRTKGAAASVLDILFLTATFFLAINIIFSSNFGDLRAYVFLGFIVGFFLYERIIGRVVTAFIYKLICALKLFVKVITNYFAFLFRFLIRILSKPMIVFRNYIIIKIVSTKKIWMIPKKTLKDCKNYYKLFIKRFKK